MTAVASSGPCERRSTALGTFLAAAVIILAGLAAYSNSFRGALVFDDENSIRDNRTIRSLWPIWAVLFSRAPCTATGRPVLNLSLALNYAWGGLDVRGYHAVNLAIHILAGLTLFGLVCRTLTLDGMPDFIKRDATGLAFAIALIWTVHPLQTESVTYIIQRAESLMGLVYFIMLYCVVRGACSVHPGLWYSAATLACATGMGTKEVMVTAPVVVLAYDRVFLCGSFREILRRRWGLNAALAATWGLLAVLMLTSGGRDNTAGFGYGVSVWDYAATQFGAIVRYLRLCFWPHPLVLDYGKPLAHSSAEIVPSAVVIVSLIAATIVALRYRPWIGFLGLWFFVILAPSSSVVPVTTQTIAEHRMYLPLAAVVSLTVLGAYLAWHRLLLRGQRSDDSVGSHSSAGSLDSAVPCALLALVAAGLGYQTYERNKDYRSAFVIWEDTLRKAPGNARAWWCRAYFRERLAKNSEALMDYSHAIRLDPDFVAALLARGLLSSKLGMYSQADADFTKVLQLFPDHPEVHIYRGNCYKSAGRFDEALQEYSLVVQQRPNSPDAWSNRGAVYGALKQPQKAVADFTKAIELAPRQAMPYLLRAIAFFDTRQFEKAWADVRMAEKLGGRPDPDFLKQLIDASGTARESLKGP